MRKFLAALSIGILARSGSPEFILGSRGCEFQTQGARMLNLKFSVLGRMLIRFRFEEFLRGSRAWRERRSDYSSIPSGRPCRSRNPLTED